MMRREFVAWLSVAAALALWPRAAQARRLLSAQGVPLPRGSKAIGDDLFESGTSLGQSVRYYQRWLRNQRHAHEAIPPYHVRGTTVARFLSREPGSPWTAIHVFTRQGRTQICVVASSSPQPP